MHHSNSLPFIDEVFNSYRKRIKKTFDKYQYLLFSSSNKPTERSVVHSTIKGEVFNTF